MKDIELLGMLEILSKNSRRSLAASEVVTHRVEDTKCAKTIRNIVEGESRSLTGAAPSPNVNRVRL